jgi:hypothetical protein
MGVTGSRRSARLALLAVTDTVRATNGRRLAAIDMCGANGIPRRRGIIMTEFVVGLIAMEATGVWRLASSSGLGDRLLALWLIGASGGGR